MGTTAFPYNIHLGQHQLAGIARDRLLAMPNAEIRFGTSLVTSGAGCRRACASRSKGRTDANSSPAKYVVGADGAGSLVRKAVGLSFDGMTWPERFIATNVFHDFEAAGYALSTMVIDDQWGAIIVKLTEGGLWRCTYMEGAELPERTFMDRLPHAYAALPGRRGSTGSSTAPRPTGCTSAAPSASGSAGWCWRATPRMSPTRPAATASPPGCSTPMRCGRRWRRWCSKARIPALLDIYAEDRRRIYLERTSPRATANKNLVFHAWGGGARAGKRARTAARHGPRPRRLPPGADVREEPRDGFAGRSHPSS